MWHLGRLKLLVESRVCASMTERLEGSEGAGVPAGTPVVVRAKLEYHSQDKTQGERITDGELASWWLATHLHACSTLWVISSLKLSRKCASSKMLRSGQGGGGEEDLHPCITL